MAFTNKQDFNPRSREGSDGHRKRLRIFFTNFNPRSREGSDEVLYAVFLGYILFQSTLPRRERPLRKMVASISSVFQSTLTRRERRFRLYYFSLDSKISIHAPAKGATSRIVDSFTFPSNFNPRSREGSDAIGRITRSVVQKFQSTRPRRERRLYQH